MADFEIPFGVKPTNPVPVISLYMNNGVPYTSAAEAHVTTLNLRHKGLTVNINAVEYWYKDGILDTDLIEKDLAKNKLEKGTFIGDADDIVQLIDDRLTDNPFLGALTPTGVPPTPSSTPPVPMKGYFETSIAGTYPNAGGVVVPVNSTARIYRDDAGGFSISYTTIAFDFSAYALKTELSNKVLNSDIFENVYSTTELVTSTYLNSYYNTSGVLQSLSNYTAINIIECNPNDVFVIEGLTSNFATTVFITQGRTLTSAGGYVGNLTGNIHYSQIVGGVKLTVPSTSTIGKIALFFDNSNILSSIKIKKNDKIVNVNDFKLKESLLTTTQKPDVIADLHKNLAEYIYIGYFYNSSGVVTFYATFSCIEKISVTAGDYISIKNITPLTVGNWFRFLNENNGFIETVTTDSLERIANGYRLKVPSTAGISKLAMWWPTSNETGVVSIYKTSSLLSVNTIKDSAIKDVNSDGMALKFYERGKITKPNQLMPCYLLAGQSNQEGRIDLAELPAFWTSNSNKITDVQNINTDDGVWHEYNATNYAVKSGTTYFSYEIMLLKLLIDYKKANGTATDKIYTVKRAEGGTSIDANGEGAGRWTPEFEKIPSGVMSLLSILEQRYITAKLSSNGSLFTPNGVIWHQGEGDRNFAENYYLNMKYVIWYIRGFTSTPTLPFILGGINNLSLQYNYDVENAKLKLANDDSFIFYVPVTNSLTNLKSDKIHFNYNGASELANNIYNIMINNYKMFGLIN